MKKEPQPLPTENTVEKTNPTELLAVTQPGFIGQLIINTPLDVQAPSEYCLDDGNLYRGAAHRLSDINLFLPEHQKIDSRWYQNTVIVYGIKEKSLWDHLTKIGPCPENYGQEDLLVQMRSDWVAPEGGYITQQSILEQHDVIIGTDIQEVLLVEQQTQPLQTTVILHNPFQQSMNGLKIEAHYEGGSGKPMPKYVELPVNLPPGGSDTIQLHNYINKDNSPQRDSTLKNSYRLYSVDISGVLELLSFDVQVFISLPR